MKPKTAMEKNSIREWISVILPVLIWLLLRYAGRNLPPAAQIGLTGFLLVVAAFLYVREKARPLSGCPAGISCCGPASD